MSFCDHCQGQRFDRARVLRILRQIRRDLRASGTKDRCGQVLDEVLRMVREMDIPHLEFEDEIDEVVH
jgi:hypothetical protein